MDATTTKRRLEETRDRLLERRGALIAESGLDAGSDDATSELTVADTHPSDVATETFEREKSVSMLEDIERQLEDVAHAFHRLEAGTYGVCEACGEPIPDARLDAQPATRFCVDDQEKFERAARAPS